MSATNVKLPFRILVADDEDIFRRSTVDILRSCGYEAEGVRDAAEGENALLKNSYNLVIADLQMNGNTDLEFVRSISTKNKIPTMIVTGFPSIKSATDSIHLLIIDYLIKPINPHEFINRVKTALEKSPPTITKHDPTEPDKRPLELNESAPMSLAQVFNNQIREIYQSLEGLQLASQLASGKPEVGSKDLCQVVKCSNLERHREILQETVAVLIRTKSSFKSKELADLRTRIETFLAS